MKIPKKEMKYLLIVLLSGGFTFSSLNVKAEQKRCNNAIECFETELKNIQEMRKEHEGLKKEILNLKKELDNIVKVDRLPIGTVIASVLSYEMFLDYFEDGKTSDKFNPITYKWAPADGREVTNSNYAKMLLNKPAGYQNIISGGVVRVPDYRGIFLRGVTVDQLVNEYQGDTTKMPNNAFVTGNESNKHTHPASTNGQFQSGPNTFDDGDRRGVNGAAGVSVGENIQSHTHPITGGDGETRPKNRSVYYYIKIN